MAKRQARPVPWWQQRLEHPTDPTEVRVEGWVSYPDPKYGLVRAYPRDEQKYLWNSLLCTLQCLKITHTDTSYFFADEQHAQITFQTADRDAAVREIIARLRPAKFDYSNGRLSLTIHVNYEDVEHFGR